MTAGRLRLAELIAALSLATDLGMGQPMELALRIAALGVGLGRQLRLGPADLSDIYYLALVEHIGCTSDSLEFAAFSGGDDIGYRRRAMAWPASPPGEIVEAIVRHTGEGRPPFERARLVVGMLIHSEQRPRQVVAAHCEAGGRLAERLGLSQGVRRGLLQEQERWDGRGRPEGLAGDALCMAQRVVSVAHDAIVLMEAGRPVLQTLRSRRGHAYDPAVVDAMVEAGPPAGAGDADAWVGGLEAEPAPALTVPGAAIDRVALALADFTDLKSPYLLGHSTRVAEVASGAADVLACAPAEVDEVRRAALLHDLGRVGVANGIWDKRGPLTESERERVRLHPYYTERILARSPALASLAVIAGSHHENLDGSGYHRGVGATQLGRPARLVRAADCLDAMASDRPHRVALPDDGRIRELRAEVDAGRLDAEAVAAVIEASGGGRVHLRPPRPAGLSEREIEVLRLLVHGISNAEIGTRLRLSPKTVGHHVEHIYNKAGVTSRAAAALFAMETGLI
jgi:HD-GYP domain-containing protein (c-di-GMP phosphodiesterase class II)